LPASPVRFRRRQQRPAGALTRAGDISGDHIDFGIAALHHHHEAEDELLYPRLIERVPGQAPMTEQVEHEHLLIKTALEEASAACAAWRGRRPRPVRRWRRASTTSTRWCSLTSTRNRRWSRWRGDLYPA
jgi:hypothetical protein